MGFFWGLIMSTQREESGTSRYESEQYNRKGSRYDSEAYNRRGSRYGKDPDDKVSDKTTESAAAAESQAKGRFEVGNFRLTGRKLGLGAAAAAGILYVIGAVHYSSHFYAGTTVMGMDCSGMTAEEVRELIEEEVGSYKLTITERGGDESLIFASQVDLTYVENDTLEAALQGQRAAFWLMRLGTGKQTQIAVQTEYSADKLQEVLEDLPFMDEAAMVKPRNAHLIYTDHRIGIEPEVLGTTLDPEAVEAVITHALDNGTAEVDLEAEACYLQPTVLADDEQLNQEMEAKNEILGACITLNFGDRTEVVNEILIESWLTREEDGSYSLGDEPVWNYIAELAAKYDTYGGERTFVSTIGTTEYLSGGDYGWQLDQDETAQTLLNAVRDKAVRTLDPVYTHTAMDRSSNDIGNTYVEICIKRQQMWFYKNGELLVDTAVVTGNPSKQNDTPAGGVWALDGKYLNFTLVGQDYRTPVSYWMPFNGGVGIHDLQSRAYFGGTIYLTNGSHGCVNTPLAAVATIYDNIEVGTPVIVYTGE